MHSAWKLNAFGLVGIALATHTALASDDFLIKPYLQLGPQSQFASASTIDVQWASRAQGTGWSLQTRESGGVWSQPSLAQSRKIDVAPVGEHWLHTARTGPIAAGTPIEYRVLEQGQVVFESTARVFNKDPQKLRAVVFGDCAAATEPQRQIAHLAGTLDPDLVVIPGDVVYSRGRLSEYLDHFFPIYNADRASPQTGAPLLRSRLFVAAAGNHDLSYTDVDKFPDVMAFYWLWSLPRNGPLIGIGNAPALKGGSAAAASVLAAAADAYPTAANYSFSSGGVHWTILDSNTYSHWDDPTLVSWLAADLKAAAGATWRFVVFHHPPFHASKTHQEDQWMRVISPTLEEGQVDLVLAGHVHNYQRSRPLRFKPAAGSTLLARGADGLTLSAPVDGTFEIDRDFDGTTVTKPRGIIYVVTGAGGAELYTDEITRTPEQLPKFTAMQLTTRHSLTVLEIDGRTTRLRQLDLEGKQVDQMTITK